MKVDSSIILSRRDFLQFGLDHTLLLRPIKLLIEYPAVSSLKNPGAALFTDEKRRSSGPYSWICVKVLFFHRLKILIKVFCFHFEKKSIRV